MEILISDLPTQHSQISTRAPALSAQTTISFANLKTHNPQSSTKNWKPMIKTQKILIGTKPITSLGVGHQVGHGVV